MRHQYYNWYMVGGVPITDFALKAHTSGQWLVTTGEYLHIMKCVTVHYTLLWVPHYNSAVWSRNTAMCPLWTFQRWNPVAPVCQTPACSIFFSSLHRVLYFPWTNIPVPAIKRMWPSANSVCPICRSLVEIGYIVREIKDGHRDDFVGLRRAQCGISPAGRGCLRLEAGLCVCKARAKLTEDGASMVGNHYLLHVKSFPLL